MDKLAQALRSDADRIDVSVSPELKRRLSASIEREASNAAAAAPAVKPAAGPGWASILTGVAAAAAIAIVVYPDRIQPTPDVVPPLESLTGALASLDGETAALTAPLTEELERLESDVRKAQQAVRREIGLSM